jgi:hypothetical protein
MYICDAMRKTLASISILVYFVFSCGLIVNLHYCMGSFESVQLYSSKSDACGKCGMPINEKTECCKDEIFFFKLKDEQNTSAVPFGIPDVKTAANLSFDFTTLLFSAELKLNHYYNHSPPLLTGQDIYLQNCVFRI